MRSHYCLAEQCTHLCSPYIKHITQAGNVLQGDICTWSSQTVSQTCTIHIKRNIRLAAYPAQSLQFTERVQCTIFSRVRNIHHSWSHHVFVSFITVKIGDICFYLLSTKLSFMLRQCQYLMSGSFDGSCLVHIDVRCFCSQYTFVAGKQPVDDSCIGLRTPNQEIYSRFGLSACLAYQFTGMACIIIVSISGCLFQISFHQAAHHFRMCPFHIVCIKM